MECKFDNLDWDWKANACFLLTMWNVNDFMTWVADLESLFSINYVECKFIQSHELPSPLTSFLLTMWNVNFLIPINLRLDRKGFLLTMWNVNCFRKLVF